MLEAEEQLLNEVSGLAVEEILALCYALKAAPQRLRLYSNALRRRGGERAQFASCLICFDLARQNDEIAQLEFGFLADTMRELASNTDLVQSLVGGDDYLTFVWEPLPEPAQRDGPALRCGGVHESGRV